MQFKPLPRNSPRIPSCCHMCRVPCHTPVYTLSFPCTCINIFSRSSGATAVRDTDPATPPARSDLLICDHDRCRFSGFGDVASLTSDPPSPFPAAPAVSAGLAIIIIVVVIGGEFETGRYRYAMGGARAAWNTGARGLRPSRHNPWGQESWPEPSTNPTIRRSIRDSNGTETDSTGIDAWHPASVRLTDDSWEIRAKTYTVTPGNRCDRSGTSTTNRLVETTESTGSL
mmetsp:Transcript_13209/g.38301  ORF Transcript_13209/g.38301 Transcript_13209/m.38301 type:complete len:228 (-) Transcript_13209:36-719(-)